MDSAHVYDALDAYYDNELSAEEMAAVRVHLADCAECADALTALSRTSKLIQDGLVHHIAPDVLRARIINAIAQNEGGSASGASSASPIANPSIPSTESPASRAPAIFISAARPLARAGWWKLLAAGLAIAVASSATTYTVTSARRGGESAVTEEAVVESHIRSLMPGHLIDIASSNQHNVKPWFNGRIDSSPQVPGLDSSGFNLVGGRLDYVAGRRVSAVVYGRRQHLINVYSWPEAGRDEAPASSETHGYHLIRWRNDNIEYWVASDLNAAELSQFVSSFQQTSAGTTPSR
jgi:anti-sigma factor RsiW